MAYIKSFRNQNYLIPPKISDLFSKDHVCYLIEQITDNLDYSEFDLKYSGPGGPAYQPRILLKLLMMGHVDGIRSSRRIAKNAQENVVYIFLAEKTSPDFRTISDFKKDNKKLVKTMSKELNLFALKEGLIDLSHLMIDGTTIKANANNDKNISKKTLEKIEKYINKLIEEGIKVDEEEDKLYGDRGMHQLPEDFDNAEKRRPIIRKIVREINKSMKEGDTEKVHEIKENLQNIKQVMKEKNLKKYSFIDPDSKFMQNKEGKLELCYNAQLVTDKNGLIISNDVVTDVNDKHQLLPNIARVEQDFGPLPEGTKIGADGGYLSQDIMPLDKRNFDIYMPMFGMQTEEKNRFDKINFKYDPESDCYICPENKEVEWMTKIKHNKYDYVEKYMCKDCPSCPYRTECFDNRKNFRILTTLPHDKIANRIKEKMLTKKGKETYKLRQQTVEPAIGDIKHNKKLRMFFTRGIHKVKTEFDLGCVAHNLAKINNLLHKKKTKKRKKAKKNKNNISFLVPAC